MNPSTYKQSFVESLSDQIIQAVLTPIAQYYEANPSEKVTIERMVSILQMEDAYSRRSRTNVVGGIQAPTAFMDHMGQNASVVVKTQKPKQQLAPGTPQCMYEFQKLPRKGMRCDNAADTSTGYCKSCMRKASVKNMIQQGRTGMPVQQQGGKPNNDNASKMMVSNYREFFRDEGTGIVFKQNPNRTVEVIMVAENGTERGLTQEEANYAFSRGMSFTERTMLQDGVVQPTPGSVSAMLSSASSSKPASIPTMNYQLPNINPQPFPIPGLQNNTQPMNQFNNQFVNPLTNMQSVSQFTNPLQQEQQNNVQQQQSMNQFQPMNIQPVSIQQPMNIQPPANTQQPMNQFQPVSIQQPSANTQQPMPFAPQNMAIPNLQLKNPLLDPPAPSQMNLASLGLPSGPQVDQSSPQSTSSTSNPSTPLPVQPQVLQPITPTSESPINLAQVSNLPIPTVQSTPIQEQPKPENNVITPGMALNGFPGELDQQYPLV